MTLALQPGRTAGRVARFTAVGAGGTVVNLALFAALHPAIGAQLANVVAAVLATVLGTAANRHFTFGARSHAGRAQVYGLLLTAASTGTVALTLHATGAATSWAELSVVTTVNAAFGVVRFAVLQKGTTKPTGGPPCAPW